MRASKSKEEALSRLGGTPTAPEPEDERVDRQWGERLAVFAECLQWLGKQRQKHGLDPLSEEFTEVMEAMTGHRDYLNEMWHDGDDETFKESLRRYMRACAAEMGRTARRRDQRPATQESLESA